MTTEIDRLLVRVEANAQQFEAAMKKLNRTLYGTQAETRKTLDRIKRDFDRAGRDMAQSFQPVQAAAQLAFAGISAYSIRAAGDAAEIRNAFDVAFGGGADAAREFADVLSERVGRSTTQVQQQMTTLRLVLDGLGLSGERADQVVRTLSERAIDIGSLFNVEDADAFRAIISGISGETEPMKRFGVVVNQAAVEAELLRLGFQGNAQDASEAAKAIARANIILARTAVANGDAARTAESTNNQFKRARGEFYEAAIVLGNQLLPAITDLTKATSDALEAFTELPEGVQLAGLAMLGLAAASGPIAAVVTGLARVVTWAGRARAALIGVTGASAAAGAAGAGAGAAAAGARLIPGVGVATAALSVGGSSAPVDLQTVIRARENDLARGRIPASQREAFERGTAALRRQLEESQQLLSGLQGIADFAETNWPEDVDPIAGFGGFGLDGINANGGTGGGRGNRSAERAAERQAEARAQLAVELDIARAQASGSETQIKAANERQRLAQLVAEYEDAGYEDAEARAAQHLAYLNEAEALEEQLDRYAQEAENRNRRRQETEQLISAQLMDQLGYAAEIARLNGDEGAIRDAERRLFIEERINELLRLRPDLSETERRAQAASEFDALDSADQSGRMRDEFRRSFADGIKAAIDGDLGSAFANLADRFTDRLLENAADGLFDILFSGGGKGGGGNILTSIFGSLFGGGRAMGGPVEAGKIYRVNENTPNSEYFAPGVSGSIIPRLKGMSVPQGGGRQVIEHRITVTPERDSFIQLSSDTATPIAAQASAQAYRQSLDAQRRAAPAMQARMRRLGAV